MVQADGFMLKGPNILCFSALAGGNKKGQGKEQGEGKGREEGGAFRYWHQDFTK